VVVNDLPPVVMNDLPPDRVDRDGLRGDARAALLGPTGVDGGKEQTLYG
jgi:hypothetical protein